MPGTCDGSDLKLALLATSAVATPECPKESYCDERDRLHRRECPPGLCRYGGKEHRRTMPCPDHGRPFGLDVAEGAAATTTKPTKPRKPKKPARRPKKKAARRRKVTARKAPARKVPKKTTKKKATKKTRR